MRSLSAILFAILIVAGNRLNAQVSKASQLFYHISEKDGLADNIVNCFFQDSRGVMWMGTQYGLNSFDGSAINTIAFIGGTSKDQLLSNTITAITEDSHQNLWITTTAGLSSLNLITKKIHTYQYASNDFMRSLATDGNKIWIAISEGILQFDISTQTFKHFVNKTVKPTNITYYLNNDCNSLYLDSKKRLWLATVNGLWQFDKARHTFSQYDSGKNDAAFDGMVNTVFEDHSGRLWIGTWSQGLKQIFPETRTVINYSPRDSVPSHIVSIVEQQNNSKNRLWLSDALTEFDPATTRFEPHDLKPIAQAASLDPRCLYISRDNLLWVSTVKGVYILDPKRQLFKHYFIIDQNSITNQNPALLSQNGKLWLGGDKKFIFKLFDDKFNLVKDYTPLIKALGPAYRLPGFAVMNITSHNKNELWLATSSGILKLDTRTNKISIVSESVSDSAKRTSGFIGNVIFNNNKVWCFPWRRGVWQFDSTQNKFKPLVINLPDYAGNPKALNFQDAVQDSLGNTWLTDMDYGVVKYTASTQKFTRIVNKDIPTFSRSLDACYVKGEVWVLSNSNVVAIDTHTDKTQSWSVPDGMNKYIYDYTNDDKGNIWIATRNGLVVFNTENHSFSQYTEEDGLINNDMSGVLKRLPGGKMLYAGENYITCFNPADLLHPPASKKLLLTEVSAGGNYLLDGKNQIVDIPPGSEKVTFKWALLNYTNPLQNRYYYKLDKADTAWNYAGNKGLAEYNNFSPGKYTFRYKAVSSDGLAGQENAVTFIVEPHFWQTWWFILIALILALGCVVLIIHYVRVREQKRSALQIQLSALEMKALRAQMNPHFIFNALNSIQECIITKNTTTAYTYLSNFSKLVRMILENSEKHFITLEDEIETLRLYLSLEKLRFDDTFEYEVNIDPQIDTSFIHMPAMIIQPFAENALWHGLIHKKGKKKLTITFEQKKNKLNCTIEDNGIGRAVAAEMQTSNHIKKRSMGMKITQERLQLLETEASININDLKDDKGLPLGTRVTIVIPLEF